MGGLNRIRSGWELATSRWGRVATAAGGSGLLLLVAAFVITGSNRIQIGLFSASLILLGFAELLLFRAFAHSKFRQSITSRFGWVSQPFIALNASFLTAAILLLAALSDNTDLFTIGLAIFSGGSLFAYGLFLMTTRSGRKQVFAQLHRLGPPGILIYLSLISFYAILFFTGLTVLLYRYQALDFSASPNRLGMRQVSTFYSWHFAQAIPLIEFNSTVKWEEPLHYDDARVGLLVAAFKLVAIAPIIATLRAFWLYRQEDQHAYSDPETEAKSPRNGHEPSDQTDQ